MGRYSTHPAFPERSVGLSLYRPERSVGLSIRLPDDDTTSLRSASGAQRRVVPLPPLDTRGLRYAQPRVSERSTVTGYLLASRKPHPSQGERARARL
jgi:hypothetical protein